MCLETIFEKLSPVAVWARSFGLMLASVAVALIVRENYPFSHNPMYSKLTPKTYYLHAVDENNDVLLFREQFGFSAIRLKKVFNTKFQKLKKGEETKQLSEMEQWGLAGEETLWQYHRQKEPAAENPVRYQRLKLVRTDIELMPAKVDESVVVIAEIDVRGAPQESVENETNR
jgi:hypothetical protein